MTNESSSWNLGRGLRWTATCVLVLIAAIWLWSDHRDHLVSFAPYLLLLLCPVMHLFGHRGHRNHHG